jgi:hypothetical protein
VARQNARFSEKFDLEEVEKWLETVQKWLETVQKWLKNGLKNGQKIMIGAELRPSDLEALGGGKAKCQIL